MSALERFHEKAADALGDLSENLTPGFKLAFVAFRPDNPELDIVITDANDLNDIIETVKRRIAAGQK